ncbi:protein involved in co-translational pathway of protein transport [Scheffersomyces stipitis CBS 6054]|uniref:Protein involved in co-translational pathway of protein transport n=1 Tax=Scheffersomyces stipitis (strain ATCC 58785 / CBS 6054 / NBRC 10063 / NRRL Y-11545) TaxID=322104 RepID=A3GFV9_PICST|nr:protein involved in co-translational pathway of protein transport [Scheffersomyces stipitis CBS 6054]EAZ63412.2 protein involved in co-translational pathway of protein transport [Scheffersomyces stipitis CBS 6054]
MSGFRLLDLVKFFLPVLPEVEWPVEAISFDERIVFTVGSGIIYLVGQIPIYGLVPNAQFKIEDPFFSFRSVFAMEKGTLFELGVLPVVTAAFFWQLAVGLKLVNVNLGLRSDRELFQTGQKLTSFVLAIVYGVGLIYSGYYDNAIRGYDPLSDSTPYGWYGLILFQFLSWSFIITLIVEVFDKGYAFGSGALSFLALQTATNLIAELVGLEIFPINNSNKFESYGALINFTRNFSFDISKIGTNVYNSFTRLQLPNFTSFYITVATTLAVVYLQNLRIELPIRSTRARGMNNVFPIRLLYTGALPVLFAYTVIANIQYFGYLAYVVLQKANVSSFALSIIASFNLDSYSNRLNLTSGALYFFSSSPSLLSTILSPIRTVVYSATVIVLATWFAEKWSYISGSAPKDISKQFKDQGISISGKRDISITKELSRVIPVAAVSGGFILAAIAVAGDLLGGLGKSAATIVGVSAAFSVLEEFMVEYQQNGGASQLSGALSGAGFL